MWRVWCFVIRTIRNYDWGSYSRNLQNPCDYLGLSFGCWHYCWARIFFVEVLQIQGSWRNSSCTNIYCRNMLITDWFNKSKVLTFNNSLCISQLLTTPSGSGANITRSCEIKNFNFLWLIWDYYLVPTLSSHIKR